MVEVISSMTTPFLLSHWASVHLKRRYSSECVSSKATAENVLLLLLRLSKVTRKLYVKWKFWETLASRLEIMSSISLSLLRMLQSNSKEVFKTSVEILLKLLDNVIKDPSNSKYRTIRLGNKIIKEKLLSALGAFELLLDVGFQRKDDDLILPGNVPLSEIKTKKKEVVKILESLDQILKEATEKMDSSKLGTTYNVKKEIDKFAYRSYKPYIQKTSFSQILNSSNLFIRMLESNSDMVMQYEDPILLKRGNKIVPREMLQMRALEKLRNIQKGIKLKTYTNIEPCFRDLMLVELVNWFNNDFFEWVDKIACKVCKMEKTVNASANENGTRVEVLNCCGQQTKFYRYNDIAYILRTRRGRCGEYANCLTFLCMCLGYDARFVYATFDHVWTEVYSYAQKRWIHVDPSDNVVDAPLMYQHGWKRQIDYVIAFSTDDVQDVTWRYTSDFKQTSTCRNKCNETELLSAVLKLREKRQEKCSEARKRFLSMRNLLEITELIVEREPTENEKRGRSSGSLDWRQERGEKFDNNLYQFTLNDNEKTAKQFNLRYSCSLDRYERYLTQDNGEPLVIESNKLWDSCNFSSRNIFRKVEKDWKMAYLARVEYSDMAEIVWSFDFTSSELRVKNYSLKFDTKTFENGHINVNVVADSGAADIIGSSQFSIIATLTGGKGDIAWQHTQLFRQSLDSIDYPFDLKLTLE